MAARQCTGVSSPARRNPMSGRIAVLVSGRGSNLQALLDAIATGRLDAEIVGVFSDKPQAPALQRVPEAARWAADARSFPDRAAFDRVMGEAVAACRPDWVVCAGYMRILGDAFIARFRGRLLNIHPSLLPKYRGLHTHARALAAGEDRHGGSVHFVVPELDAGSVVAQASIPVLPGDTAQTLAQRLLPQEHALLVAVMRLATAGRIAERDGMAFCDGQPVFRPLRLDSAGNLTPPDTASSP
jgi:phosphoribosylglycinamide formyltransferase-1